MHLFEIRVLQCNIIYIFAYSFDHAVNLLINRWIINENHEIPDFTIHIINRMIGAAKNDHLRHALAVNVAGIGVYDTQHGWTILPPEKFEEIA